MIEYMRRAIHGHKPFRFALSIADLRLMPIGACHMRSRSAQSNESISAMHDPKIVLDQTDETTVLWEVSDEELEAVSGVGKTAAITLYHASYCFACPS